ncbi:MAG: DUF535 family protein [Nevskia sp.]|nr:DUF535 family protein [Nevskia sp.]
MSIRVWELSARIPRRKERLRYAARIWLCWPWVAPLLRLLAGSPLEPLLRRDPMILHRARRPYLSSSWSRARRLQAVVGHYRFVMQHLGTAFVVPVYLRDGLFLAGLDKSERGYELFLSYEPRFGNEGEITLSLRRRADRRRLCSLTFTIDPSGPGGLALRIGCIHADNGADTLELIRDFTRDYHGMRPKALLLWASRQLADRLGAHSVMGIRDSRHVYQHGHYARSYGGHVRCSYEELWLEAGGSAYGDWIEMSATTPPREPGDIPARKRARYARRYHWLNAMATDLRRSIDAVTPRIAPAYGTAAGGFDPAPADHTPDSPVHPAW